MHATHYHHEATPLAHRRRHSLRFASLMSLQFNVDARIDALRETMQYKDIDLGKFRRNFDE